MNQLSAGLSIVPKMDENQFLRWQSLLEERTGMCVAPERRTFLQSNLNVRMRELGYQNMQDYYQHVTTGTTGAIEWNTLVDRSEEHTSELQSRPHLVCRLLLEKKKQ